MNQKKIEKNIFGVGGLLKFPGLIFLIEKNINITISH